MAGFISKYRFAIWPLFEQHARPPATAVGIEELYAEYEQCVESVVGLIREVLMREVHGRQEALKREMADIALQAPGHWRIPPSSFVFVHPNLTTDQTDELWPYDRKCGFLGLLQKELTI